MYLYEAIMFAMLTNIFCYSKPDGLNNHTAASPIYNGLNIYANDVSNEG